MYFNISSGKTIGTTTDGFAGCTSFSASSATSGTSSVQRCGAASIPTTTISVSNAAASVPNATTSVPNAATSVPYGKGVSGKSTQHVPLNIAVAGTGYVGLSIATLLAQHNHVTAVDIVPEKVEMINNRKSPIQDEYIEDYLANKELDLTATLDGKEAYRNAEFVWCGTPTNYDSQKNYFDTSAVEAVIELVLKINRKAVMVIKSTILSAIQLPYGKIQDGKYHFQPGILRESRALYDNLYPSRIIVGFDQESRKMAKAAHTFASLLQEGALKPGIDTLFMAPPRPRPWSSSPTPTSHSAFPTSMRLDTYAEMMRQAAAISSAASALDPASARTTTIHPSATAAAAERHRAASGKLWRRSARIWWAPSSKATGRARTSSQTVYSNWPAPTAETAAMTLPARKKPSSASTAWRWNAIPTISATLPSRESWSGLRLKEQPSSFTSRHWKMEAHFRKPGRQWLRNSKEECEHHRQPLR